MADATSDANVVYNEQYVPNNRDGGVLKTSEVAAIGRFAALDASTGKYENGGSSSTLINGAIWLSEAKRGIEGTVGNANRTGDGTIEWSVKWGQTFEYEVTGASAETDRTKKVWVTDNQTLTLTAPSAGTPIGTVKKYLSGTTCLIQGYTYEQAIGNFINGGSAKIINLGTLDSRVFEGTSALTLINSLPLPGKGSIVGFRHTVLFKDPGVLAGSQTFTIEINGTPVTGGSLVWDFNVAQGAITTATITAANVYDAGDTLNFKMAASGSAATADEDTQVMFEVILG